jgi:hypothetical protein
MKRLEDRARIAYFRRFGPDADVPSVSVDERAGIVELYNIRGVLGAYRVTADGTLRWDEKLAAGLQREYDRLHRKRIFAGNKGEKS